VFFFAVLSVGFCHCVMVPLNMTYLHCLQHSILNISSIYIAVSNYFRRIDPKSTKNTFFLNVCCVLVFYVFLCCSVCWFLYRPFCHCALKLDISTFVYNVRFLNISLIYITESICKFKSPTCFLSVIETVNPFKTYIMCA